MAKLIPFRRIGRARALLFIVDENNTSVYLRRKWFSWHKLGDFGLEIDHTGADVYRIAAVRQKSPKEVLDKI